MSRQVAALPVPEIVAGDVTCDGRRTEWICGDAAVYSFEGRTEERERCARASWRANRAREIDPTWREGHTYNSQIRIAEDKLAKLQAKR